MSTPAPFAEQVRKAFAPNARGAVGVVDELLEVCREETVQLEWQDGVCRVHRVTITPAVLAQLSAIQLAASIPIPGAGPTLVAALTGALGSPEPIEVPIPKSAFRAILARLAALCNERAPGSTSPYGGEGELLAGGSSPAAFRVSFTNTPDAQRAEVRFLGEKPSEARGP